MAQGSPTFKLQPAHGFTVSWWISGEVLGSGLEALVAELALNDARRHPALLERLSVGTAQTVAGGVHDSPFEHQLLDQINR
jgi:hypothetical protein